MGLLNNLGNQIGVFLSSYGLLAIFAVMLLKEIGVPVPVPSDLIMITAGVQAAAGSFGVLELLLALEFAVLVGGSVQFFLVRSAGRAFIYRAGRLVGLTPERLDRAGAMLQRRGPLAVFVGLNVPGARAGIIPAAGLAGLGYTAFAAAMLGGSGVFYGWHIALGYLAGPSATALLERLNIPLLPVVIALAVLGLLVWLLLRVRARRRAAQTATTSAVDPLNSWADAACPVCLTIAAVHAVHEARRDDAPAPDARAIPVE
jgi:membrane protein DedA with SNARE-associated domain